MQLKSEANNNNQTVDYVPEVKDRPLYQSYDVAECSGIYAGEYPGNINIEVAKLKINQIYEFGIRYFIDLTEENELAPYEHLLPKETTYLRFPIQDGHTPKTVDEVHELLYKIKEFQKKDGSVYIHCWGGVGRTGTIVACILAEFLNIKDINEVLKLLRLNFSKMPKSTYRRVPENKYQVQFVKKFIKSLK